MARRIPGGLPPEIERIAEQIEAFRNRRRGRRPRRLPERLWARAVGLARRHGVNSVARGLRLDYYGLKRRLLAAPGPCEAPRRPAGDRPAGRFLELVGSSVAPAFTIEMEDGAGRKMAVRLPSIRDGNGTDLVALTQAFWRLPAVRARRSG